MTDQPAHEPETPQSPAVPAAQPAEDEDEVTGYMVPPPASDDFTIVDMPYPPRERSDDVSDSFTIVDL